MAFSEASAQVPSLLRAVAAPAPASNPSPLPGEVAPAQASTERMWIERLVERPSQESEDTKPEVSPLPLPLLKKRWCSGMQRTSAMIVEELYAEQPDVTFDEVVTARKEKSRQYKLRQMRFLFLPGSPQLNAWRATMVVVVLVAVISAPLEMAFSYSYARAMSGFTWVLKLIDSLFFLDMAITFNVATISHGRMETNRLTLAKNYARSWMIPDFLINFPWDEVLQEHGKTRKIAKILKLPKVFRVTRLLRVADEEAQFFGTAANLAGLLLMGHYLSCIWVGMLIDCTEEQEAQNLCPDVLTAYLQGLSVGIASLGGSDSWMRFILEPTAAGEPWAFQWHAQYTALCELVAALSCLLGFVLIGMLFSNLGHAMDRHHSHTRLFHARISNLQAAAHQHAIPRELFGRIKRHYYYVWSCGSDTSKAILTDSTLSLDLRRELAYCFYGDILKQVPFLELTDKHFLQQLCEFVEMEIFAAQDRIICAGDVGTELYFVAVGEVEVVLPNGRDSKGAVIKTLHEGSFFGELGLLFPDSKHKVDVFGSTAGWLLVIPRGTLEKLCTDELLNTFRFVALERLRKQPEMAHGMTLEQEGSRPPSDRSQCSQVTQSEVWNPHAEEGHAHEERPAPHPQEEKEKSENPARSHARRMSSFDLGSDLQTSGGPVDKGTIRKLLTCRTEVFRKPDIFRRRHTLGFGSLQHCELSGVGHLRAAVQSEDAVSAATSGHDLDAPSRPSTPGVLHSLHKVESGIHHLMRRMNTMEAALSNSNRGENADSAAPGGTG